MGAANLPLEGKVAIVTGGSRGIGKGIAVAFASHGADVAVCSRNQSVVEEVAAEIEQRGQRGLAIRADISQPSDVQRVVDTMLKAFGQVDILVNCAGILELAAILDTTEDQWNRTFDVILKGPFLCSQAVAKVMIPRQSGHIINVSSNGGFKVFDGMGAYCVAKAALNMLTRTMARQLGPDKIQVNGIAPGIVSTEMVADYLADPEARKRVISEIPLGFISEPEDIAPLAVYLASQGSRFMTGETIVIDGGVIA